MIVASTWIYYCYGAGVSRCTRYIYKCLLVHISGHKIITCLLAFHRKHLLDERVFDSDGFAQADWIINNEDFFFIRNESKSVATQNMHGTLFFCVCSSLKKHPRCTLSGGVLCVLGGPPPALRIQQHTAAAEACFRCCGSTFFRSAEHRRSNCLELSGSFGPARIYDLARVVQ